MLKKIICGMLIFAALLSLMACGGKYAPVPSTEEEERVVMTFEFEGEKYEMRYELYRAFFLTYKSRVDKGDSSVWTGENKDKYIAEIDSIIINSAADIFSAFHIAKKIGKNPFSVSVDKQIENLIEASVEGGVTDSGVIEGFGGDYDAYLASLREYYINYSVSTLLMRYSIAYSEIVNYYKGNIYEEELDEEIKIGELSFTEEDVRAFYDGDNSVRVLMATLDARSFTAERARQIRDTISGYASETGVKNYIISFTATTAEDGLDGMLIGRNSLDEAYFAEITEAAFALSAGETSEVIYISSQASENYYILYKTDKTEEFYQNNKTDIYSVFADNEIGKIIKDAKDGIIKSAAHSKILNSLERDKIDMD